MARAHPVARFLRRNTWAMPVIIVTLLVAIGGGIYISSQPAQGTFRYGLCRTFLEFEFAYPPTIDILSVTEEATTARLYFAEKNPFGNERIVQADCDYQIDAARNKVVLKRMTFDRKPVSNEHIALYNRMIPPLMAFELNKDLPPKMPDSLDRLKR